MIRDIAIRTSDSDPDFSLRSHCVTALFLSHLGEVNIPGISKVAIIIVSEVRESIFHKAEKVLMYKLEANVSEYFTLPSGERRYWVLRRLYEVFIHLSREFQLDKSGITYAYNECLNARVCNSYYMGKEAKSQDGERYAMFYCSHEEEEFIVYMQTFHKSGVLIDQKKIISAEPHWSRFNHLFGKITTGKGVLALYGKDGALIGSHKV